jgi:hypothetical protein
MSRQEQIYNDMVAQKERLEALQEITSTSKVSAFGGILFMVSFAIDSLCEMFEIFKQQVFTQSNEKERRTANWYRQKALDFQYGYELVEGKDYYDNSELTEAEIEQSKIIKYAIAVEESDKSTLYIKIANADKQPLTGDQLEAFTNYINDVADMGVHITVRNEASDNLQLNLNVWYNPTLLNENGTELNSSNEPVKEAIQTYLSNLNFNEEYINMKLIDALQQLPAVKIVEVSYSSYKYGVLNWQPINGRYTPYAGHISINHEDLQINYIKY